MWKRGYCATAPHSDSTVFLALLGNVVNAQGQKHVQVTGEAEYQIAISPEESFDGSWPFKARYSNAAGAPMHYVDEGDGEETLLLLHGEPTWSYLYRHQIRVWSEHFRVIAVDHMGFGKSATPAGRTFWLQDHVDNLEKLVLDLDLNDITLVMHDFGGPVGMGFAFKQPDRIKRFISVNGPTPAGQPDLGQRLAANFQKSPWFQWVAKAHDGGYLEQVLQHLDFSILSTLKLNGFERNDIISPQWLKAYKAPFPEPYFTQGAIGWALGVASGQHEFAAPHKAVKRKIMTKPALAIWGEKDKTLNHDQFIPLFRQVFVKGKVILLKNAGHYSPEDAPEEIAQLVTLFVSNS